MKISDFTAVLQRVQQIAGDVEVVLKGAENDVESVVTDLGLHLDPSGTSDGGKLTISHGDAPEPAAEPPADAQA